MGAQFTSSSASFATLNTETITITRDVAQPGYPVTYAATTIYSGLADFQEDPKSLVFNPSGAVDAAIGMVVIDPDSSGVLPTVLPNDILTFNGTKYAVVESALWTFTPKHLEITVKRGPLPYEKR